MTIPTFFRTFAVSVLATGCTLLPSTSPVVEARPAVAGFEGTWTGQFVNRDAGVAGVVELALAADANGSEGQVVLQGLELASGPLFRAVEVPATLPVEVVEIDGFLLRVRLEPFTDRTTGDRVTATFEGLRSGDTVTGSYVFEWQASELRVRGAWMAAR